MDLYLTEKEREEFEGGENLPLNFYLKAQDKIDELTFNRVAYKGFENLTEFQKNNIKKNLYRLAKHFQIVEQEGNAGNIASYSVLDISVTLDTSKTDEEQGIPKEIYNDLAKTGLMVRRL